MTEVVNIYKIDKERDDVVYIGRGSKWGNPYSHREGTKATFKVETRDESINEYRKFLWKQIKDGNILIEDLLALDGKRLACFCKPNSCHGDIILAAIEWAKTK